MLREQFIQSQIKQSPFCELSVPSIRQDMPAAYRQLPIDLKPAAERDNLLAMMAATNQQFMIYEMLRRAMSLNSKVMLQPKVAEKTGQPLFISPFYIPLTLPGAKVIKAPSCIPEFLKDDAYQVPAGIPTPEASPVQKSPKAFISSPQIQSPKRKLEGDTTIRRKRNKSSSKKRLDNDDKSPISGIVIKKVKSSINHTQNTPATHVMSGDIDSKYNVVDRSEESKKKLASIPNVIGDYICHLCREKFIDVYSLAEHKCPSITFIEYKCPECLKVFNCPANLASHRRWHKPKQNKREGQSSINEVSFERKSPHEQSTMQEETTPEDEDEVLDVEL